MMTLTNNFSLYEMTKSDTATRKDWDNTPPDEVVEALKTLCVKVLQPIRDKIGEPIIVGSGYRSPKLNKHIGGSKTSQHMEGEAADIEALNMSVDELYAVIKGMQRNGEIEADQCIEEFGDWIHISYTRKKPNRNMFMYARRKNGKTVYSLDLTAGSPPKEKKW